MKKFSTLKKIPQSLITLVLDRIGYMSFRKFSWRTLFAMTILLTLALGVNGQISLLQDYQNNESAAIGTFQGINFREAGFSGLYAIPHTNGKEFWTVSDRGVNVDAANANPATCRPTYDKIYGFPGYAPKIHRIRLNPDNSVQILQTITMKRPDGTNASGIINPTGFGSTATEVASTDTVLNCANFNLKIASKDVWGIDSEGIVVDKEGFFWICEEGGPTIWKLNQNGVVVKRFTPYANLVGAQTIDVQIDSVFKYRKNNRGFEGISMTPNGKIYAIIQSPVLYPSKSVGEATRVHRILEIDPSDNSTRMFAYLNDGIIGASGSNQIRLRDWKIGDMAAINDHTFLVLEAALRGTSDIKRMYLIDINGATPVTSGLYGGLTLEALVDGAGLSAKGITPVQKTLFMDLLANGWNPVLDKAEGLAILNDSTIAISNDNDFGQYSPLENGIATATPNKSHVFVYGLKGSNKLRDYQSIEPLLSQGITGLSTTQTPYLQTTLPGASFTSILSVNDVVGGYKMVGIPDGLGAFDNNNGTFTLLMNHELGNTVGAIRAHGSIGSFVSKWTINKSDLSVVSGSDLIHTTYLWDIATSSFIQTPALFNRFCSADLPAVSALYNSSTGLGTQERIYFNGEEAGSEGRGFGHIVTGPNAGTSYQLPRIGRLSFENSLARPYASDKTVVASTDDSTPGQVYFYIGTKTNTGTEIEKAGLNNGKLYGVAVSGLSIEVSGSMPSPGTAFSLIDLGNVQNMTGAELNTASNTAGVTNFLRPEDGNWDPANPNDFYFVTTNAFTSPSRLWRLRFTDLDHPELGGTIDALLDGTEGQKMLDNITLDNHGHILMQEDVGNQSHIGKIWQYTIATDALVQVAQHDPSRFINGAAGFLTQDEESSGIIDLQEILGAGWFLCDVQAHYGIAGEVVEGGQLLAFYNPDTRNANAEINIVGNGLNIEDGDTTPSPSDNTEFSTVNGGSAQSKTFTIANEGPGTLAISGITFTGANADEFKLLNASAFPLNIKSDSTEEITVQFAPLASGIRTSTINVLSNDVDERKYDFALGGKGCVLTVEPISGPTNACAYSGNIGGVATYSVSTTDAGSFNWKLPTKAILVSGQGTNSIQVKYLSSFTSGIISVNVSNTCGGSAITKTLAVMKSAPEMPAVIEGPTSACSFEGTGTPVVYSIAPVSDAVSYFWQVPDNVALISGQGSTSITVLFNSGFTTSNLKVKAISGCGNSANQTIKINGNVPLKPGTIAGIVNGLCSEGNAFTYSIDPVSFATSYIWSTNIPGSVISSDGTTASIIFPSFVSGTVSVTAKNDCGISVPRNLNVTSRPGTPSIIEGPDHACIGSVQTFSISPIEGVVSYKWSVPKGSVIQSGAGTTSITVLMGCDDGLVKVSASNQCSTSFARTLEVEVDRCDGEITVFPNPTRGVVNISFKAKENETYSISIKEIISGKVVFSTTSSVAGDNTLSTDLTSLPKGVYFVHLKSQSVNSYQRIKIE